MPMTPLTARAEDQPDLALEGGIPGLLGTAVRPARTRLTSHPSPATWKGGPSRHSRSRCRPKHIGQPLHTPRTCKPDTMAENRHNTTANQPPSTPESSRSGLGNPIVNRTNEYHAARGTNGYSTLIER